MREFAIRKRKFLNSANRQVVANQGNGQEKYVAAAATGIGFFKKGGDLESGPSQVVEDNA